MYAYITYMSDQKQDFYLLASYIVIFWFLPLFVIL